MPDAADDIDEVALNALLAEGVDLPTALEASRSGCDAEASRAGCLGVAIIILAVSIAATAVLI
jgi:hypothetical protein